MYKRQDITFANQFYVDQIQACEAMDKSYTAKFNEQHTVDEVKNLIGYDWPADWEANSNSMNVRHQGITIPITRLMSGTHNAIADKNHDSIKKFFDFLVWTILGPKIVKSDARDVFEAFSEFAKFGRGIGMIWSGRIYSGLVHGWLEL